MQLHPHISLQHPLLLALPHPLFLFVPFLYSVIHLFERIAQVQLHHPRGTSWIWLTFKVSLSLPRCRKESFSSYTVHILLLLALFLPVKRQKMPKTEKTRTYNSKRERERVNACHVTRHEGRKVWCFLGWIPDSLIRLVQICQKGTQLFSTVLFDV